MDSNMCSSTAPVPIVSPTVTNVKAYHRAAEVHIYAAADVYKRNQKKYEDMDLSCNQAVTVAIKSNEIASVKKNEDDDNLLKRLAQKVHETLNDCMALSVKKKERNQSLQELLKDRSCILQGSNRVFSGAQAGHAAQKHEDQPEMGNIPFEAEAEDIAETVRKTLADIVACKKGQAERLNDLAVNMKTKVAEVACLKKKTVKREEENAFMLNGVGKQVTMVCNEIVAVEERKMELLKHYDEPRKSDPALHPGSGLPPKTPLKPQ